MITPTKLKWALAGLRFQIEKGGSKKYILRFLDDIEAWTKVMEGEAPPVRNNLMFRVKYQDGTVRIYWKRESMRKALEREDRQVQDVKCSGYLFHHSSIEEMEEYCKSDGRE